MITMEAETNPLGKMTIAGSCAKTAKAEVSLPSDFAKDPDQFHLRTVGKMIEANESVLRNEVTENYTNKQRQITNSGRLMEEYMTKSEKNAFQAELAAATAKIAATQV